MGHWHAGWVAIGCSTLQVKVTGAVADDALLLEPVATASNLTLPAHGEGGALLRRAGWDQDRQERYVPEQARSVQSADGLIQVSLPKQAHGRPLTIRAVRLAAVRDTLLARKEILPTEGPFGRSDLDAFVLEATDDSGQTVHKFHRP